MLELTEHVGITIFFLLKQKKKKKKKKEKKKNPVKFWYSELL